MSWSDTKRPTDSSSLNGQRLLGQASAATRPLGSRGAVVRVGASIEQGQQRTSLSQNVPGSGSLNDTDYGSREYGARDPEGNVWSFGTYQPFAFDHEATAAATTSCTRCASSGALMAP